MRIYTSTVSFDNAGNIATLERGLCCEKLDSRQLAECRKHWLAHKNDSRFTGTYEISCSYGHSIQAQIIGAYANNTQYYYFVELH